MNKCIPDKSHSWKINSMSLKTVDGKVNMYTVHLIIFCHRMKHVLFPIFSRTHESLICLDKQVNTLNFSIFHCAQLLQNFTTQKPKLRHKTKYLMEYSF
ncbi:hypothetical protein AQUCO_02700106v1 [Aquilegia coerulea]|uniref:Uncharacterized protein n=1 Tax=Aquilegia coerulea TaxID=218851 RepID=A0A2G5D554_AQUCA|nr:hypothetical protein AQUCO_02700106v1 [Aquilegia coerulea]